MSLKEQGAEAGFSASNLTALERKSLSLVAEGLSADGIAGKLGLTESEISSALQSASQKLGARNRLHAVSLALRHGIIESDGKETFA